jgi:hypothetical protein
VFFEDLGVPGQLEDYQRKWAALFTEKVDISTPGRAYKELLERFPEKGKWKVKPWTLI